MEVGGMSIGFVGGMWSGGGRRIGLRTCGKMRMSAVEIAGDVKSGKRSAEEVTREYLDRVEKHDEGVNAYLCVDAEAAIASARKVDAAREKGETLGRLAGVPIAVKDNLCTKGMVTTAGSRILENYYPPYTATAISKLEAEGAVVIGKTNMDEFGMGSSTEGSAFQVTVNPWNKDCVSGGSSGGSAAAVASGSCAIAVGSDTGGSIRQPASYCGVTGLKCSYGRVSRHGLLAYASSLDTVGPVSSNVLDSALALQIMAGFDQFDSTSLPGEVPDYYSELTKATGKLDGVKIGIIDEAFGDGVDEQVAKVVNSAIDVLKSLGADVQTTSLPRLRAATAAYYILAPSEASANLARYDGIRYGERFPDSENVSQLYTKSRKEGFGEEVKRRIMVGTFALSTGYYDAFYLRAQKIRTLVGSDFQDAFKSGFDVLVSPVAPKPAFRVGEKVSDPISMYAEDILTIPASMAGLPAMSIPCGFSDDGLPIGLQITGPFAKESDVLAVGHAYQLNTDFHMKTPPS